MIVRKISRARNFLCAVAIALSPAALADENLSPLTLTEHLDAYQKQAVISTLLDDLVADHRIYLEISGDAGTWEPENSGYRVLAQRRDLDGDGVDEVIAEVRSSGSCGSGGCTTYILRHQDGAAWTVIANLFGPEVLISNRKTRGLPDLVVRGKSGEKYRHTWTGKKYEEEE
jgi:hypothetical protein